MNIFWTILIAIITAVITSGGLTVIIEFILKREDKTWELKRKACVKALRVAEAVLSNYSWDIPEPERIKKEKITTEEARRSFNELITYCNNDEVPNLFKDLVSPDSKTRTKGDDIVDLRNAVRRELGFKKELDTNRERAFIGRVAGDKD